MLNPGQNLRDDAASVAWTGKAGNPPAWSGLPPEGAGANGPSSPEPFSTGALLKRFARRTAIIEQVLAEFEEQAARNVAALEEGVKSLDAPSVASVAHALKGAASLLSAHAVHAAAAELEEMGHRRRLGGAEGCLRRLKAEIGLCISHFPLAPLAIHASERGVPHERRAS